MFPIENQRDLKLMGRAVSERWAVDRDAVKAALMEALKNPELAVKAAKILITADELDFKRSRVETKAETAELEYRARIIKVLQTVPEYQLRLAAQAGGIPIPDGPLFPTT
jgi:hypothetical protein